MAYGAERARFLFGQYRKGEANDPEIYVASIAAILSEYPAETIRYVTDPRTGIAANPPRDKKTGMVWTGMPNPAEVKNACEKHYGPERRRIERDAVEHRQLQDRARALPDNRPRKTYEQLVEDCRRKGLNIGPKVKPIPAPEIDALCASAGMIREQFDALPDAPKGKTEAA